MQTPARVALPLTAECAFWASLMFSWLAQDGEGLLTIDLWALGLIGFFALALSGAAFGSALRRPWLNGSMKLTAALAKMMFVTMIIVTGAWVVFGLIYARTDLGQGLYGLCALLSGWSATAIFLSLRSNAAFK
jgi:hypothetical protein